MKRDDLLHRLCDAGCVFVRRDWYAQPASGVQQPIPRHHEINEQLARHILRQLAR